MEFKKMRIEDICSNICSGGTPKSNKNEYYKNGNIPWLNTKEVNFNYIYNTEKKITGEGLINSAAKIIDENNVIIAMYGATAGRVAINKIKLSTNQACCNLKIDESIANYMYIYYYLKMNYKKLSDLANGGAQQNLNSLIIKNFEIYLPNLNIQNKIAKILSLLDKKIELNNQINNNLLEIQKCYFQKLFKDNDNYETVKLDELCNISAGGDAPKEKSNIKSKRYNIPIISNGTDNDGIYGYTDNAKITTKSVTISARGTIGFKVLRNYDYYPIVRLISLFPKTDRISSEYLFYILDEIVINGTGTTQQQLTVPMVKNLKIKIFEKELIDKFTAFSVDLNNMIDKNKKENQSLKQLRDTLLPKLMNGAIDLNKIKI